MYQIIIVVHVLLGLSVIGFVLIQQGKGADAGAAFGSASSGSVFGAQGASSFLSRTTAVLATLFFATSLGLAILIGHQDSEVDLMDQPEVEEVFEDVPLIDGGINTPATESVPVISNDAPVTITEDVQSTTDGTETIIEEVKIEAVPE